jgi:hypothetical protein
MRRIETGNRHATPRGLGHLIKSRTIRLGTIRTESGYRAGNDARIDVCQCCVINLEPFGNACTEITDDDIGLADQIIENFQSLRGFQVNGDTALVAVQGDVIGTEAVQGVFGIVGQQLARTLTLGWLDLDGFRTQVSQDHGTIRA